MMVKITKQQIKDYFKKHNYSTYADVAKEFNVCHELIRKKFKNEIISSLNYKSKYIAYKDNLSFDSNNLTKLNTIVFSKQRDIKSTVFNIVKTNDLISSEKLYNLFEFNVRQQVSQLIKTRKIFIKKQAKHSLYSINPFEDKIIVKEKFDITSLKEGDKLLKDLQIINEIKYQKKIDVARKFNINPKTINDIKKRFEIGGARGLIHTRRPNTTKISSSVQAAIITEAVKHPEKSPKEIKKSVNKPISLKVIIDTLEKIKNSIEPQKKLLLEVQ